MSGLACWSGTGRSSLSRETKFLPPGRCERVHGGKKSFPTVQLITSSIIGNHTPIDAPPATCMGWLHIIHVYLYIVKVSRTEFLSSVFVMDAPLRPLNSSSRFRIIFFAPLLCVVRSRQRESAGKKRGSIRIVYKKRTHTKLF